MIKTLKKISFLPLFIYGLGMTVNASVSENPNLINDNTNTAVESSAADNSVYVQAPEISEASKEFGNTIKRYFHNADNIFKEKLYLHTDKPFYGAGDNIWYKAYLLNGLTYRDNSPTNYIYVELYNHNDSLIVRQKIRRDNQNFAGNIELPAEILPGDYYLRSYTSWMQNWDADYFYQKNIRIGNSIAKKLESRIEYKKDAKKNYVAELTMLEDGKPFVNKNISYQVRNKDRAVVRKSAKTTKEGKIIVPLDQLKGVGGVFNFDLDDKMYKYKNSYVIPSGKEDFDVSFFPEGGSLLDGVAQNVAFKVINSDGLSVKAAGYVIENNDTISDIMTEHDGMGVFSLFPSSENKYKVIMTTEDNIRREFSLPQVEKQGMNITIAQNRGLLLYNILTTEDTPVSDQLYLIIQTRGKMLLSMPLNSTNMRGQYSLKDFPEGIIHFLVADGRTKKPITERLTLVQNNDLHQWDISMTAKEQRRRSHNAITLSVKDSEGNPLQGNFSVALTDAAVVRPDSLAENIRSSILMSSELKGYIENPGYYFSNTDAKSRKYGELLMMTHGWRKYVDFDFTKIPDQPDKHFIEQGQYITGLVKNATGSTPREVGVRVWSLESGANYRDTVNARGEFFIQGIEFADSTRFRIRASRFSGKELPLLTVYPESHYFPRAYNRNPYNFFKEVNMDDYLRNTQDKYYYEGGMRVYNLKEVEVTARKEEPGRKSAYSHMAEFSMTASKLEERMGLSLIQILQEFPGVYSEDGEYVKISGSQGYPLILINDIQYTGEDGQQLLQFTEVLDVERIDILRNATAAIFGNEGANGAIIVTMKRGASVAKKDEGIVTFMPMGYSKTAKFYVPKYETLEQIQNNLPDMRTTIHWQPVAQTDSEGNIVIEYYNIDIPDKTHLEVEGVTTNGAICRFTTEF